MRNVWREHQNGCAGKEGGRGLLAFVEVAAGVTVGDVTTAAEASVDDVEAAAAGEGKAAGADIDDASTVTGVGTTEEGEAAGVVAAA